MSSRLIFILIWVLASSFSAFAGSLPSNRIASIFMAQDYINEQLTQHIKGQILKKLTVALDSENNQIFLRGIIEVPLEELRAINLDPKLGKFRFQVTIKLLTTKLGHLILEFPLEETFFYPADSKDPKHERVIIPVQLLSLGLASVRGYLAALSGDFSGFDRRTAKLEVEKKTLDHLISEAKNNTTRDSLRNQRESIRLQLAAVPIERKQLENLSKEYEKILGFTGEKELSLNDELAAHKNALILKIKLSQLVPYLKGVELEGVRIIHDKKDGTGQNYLAVDVDTDITGQPVVLNTTPRERPPVKIPPSLMIRLNQSLFESEAVVDAEKKQMGSKIKDFDVQLKDDGLHVAGKYRAFIFHVPFDTIVDFVGTGPDVFEVRVRDIKVAGLDLEFLTTVVLESMKKRLDQSLKNICTFTFIGEEKDHSRALQVKVDPKKLVPAFPDLHLVGVDVREREFLLKVGKIN
jgi:hypothetical protein